jgi:midasin
VQQGHWVLLDELNLAGQQVLEGLNGLLDHRAALFVPELGRSFPAHPRFRLFGAQNPLQEGGGRKGLPRSFLNRFTRVSVELLGAQDLSAIAAALHPALPPPLLQRMVALLDAMQAAAGAAGGPSLGAPPPFAVEGGPWEFNLRDLLRWCELVEKHACGNGCSGSGFDGMEVDTLTSDHHHQQQQQQQLNEASLDAAAEHYAGTLFTQRLRTAADRRRLLALFEGVWGRPLRAASSAAVLQQRQDTLDAAASGQDTLEAVALRSLPALHITPTALHLGVARMHRANGGLMLQGVVAASPEGSSAAASPPPPARGSRGQQSLLLPAHQSPLLESMLSALSAGWMVLLVGPGGSGKTSLARLAACLAGVGLQELALTQSTDTSDLLGSFEQVSVHYCCAV